MTIVKDFSSIRLPPRPLAQRNIARRCVSPRCSGGDEETFSPSMSDLRANNPRATLSDRTDCVRKEDPAPDLRNNI